MATCLRLRTIPKGPTAPCLVGMAARTSQQAAGTSSIIAQPWVSWVQVGGGMGTGMCMDSTIACNTSLRSITAAPPALGPHQRRRGGLRQHPLVGTCIQQLWGQEEEERKAEPAHSTATTVVVATATGLWVDCCPVLGCRPRHFHPHGFNLPRPHRCRLPFHPLQGLLPPSTASRGEFSPLRPHCYLPGEPHW